MIIKHSLVLLFLCCSVIGSKSNETVLRLDRDDSETENNSDSQNTYVNPQIKYSEKKEVFFNESNSVNLNDIVDIWNPYTVARIWNRDAYETLNISVNCEKHITDYMVGVSTGKQWAVRMMDATGKYTWGLLSGNKFWIGAADLCRGMKREFIEWRKNDRIPRGNGVPPFLVSVTSVTLRLKILRTELNGSYNVMLGLCLPDSCDKRDVEKLLYFVQDQSGNDLPRELQIQNIRSLSKGYSFWDDSVFYALLITFIVVLTFILLGTFYDIALRYQVLREKKEKNQNTDNVITEMKIYNPDGNINDEITIAKLWSVKNHNGAIDVQNSNNVPKPLSEALLSFSLLLNISKLCSLDVGSDTLAPIHGLRFFSLLWVILIHTCTTTNEITEDRTFRSSAERDFLYQTISNGTYAVDTFFFISGCLVSFLYFRTMNKENMQKKKITKGCHGQVLQFLGMIWYRYFRLTPPYLLVIGLVQVSMSWYYDNTVMELYTLDYRNCRKYWWRNALYINTYFDIDERCIVWSWYLANDTQFYAIGIIILIIGASFLPVAAIMTIFFLLASWISTAVITLHTKHVPSIQDPFAHYESLYDKPWSRIGPYLIGMIAGWYLYKTDCKLKINKAIVVVCWILSAITMLSIVYGIYGSMFGPVLSAMYTALSHSGWAIAVAWVLIACVTGHGGLVNKILSWKYLYPLSRLSYCTYLIHPTIMRAVVLRGESSMHLTQGLMAILFFGFTVASYAVSLFISLLFEAPVVSLLRILHPLRRWKNAK